MLLLINLANKFLSLAVDLISNSCVTTLLSVIVLDSLIKTYSASVY